MKIKKGDTVKIMKGKDVGKQGKVLKILSEQGKVVVEGVNVFKKHIKGDGKDKESTIVDIVKPLFSSNVMVVCNSCGKPSRIEIKVEKGKKIRICKRCGKSIDQDDKTMKKGSKETKKKSVKGKKKVKSVKKSTKPKVKKTGQKINSKSKGKK
jgi:large subunit ribosomal protein L24